MNLLAKYFGATILFSLFAIISICPSPKVLAQTSFFDQGIAGALEVNINPEKPKPEQEVTVSIQSYSPLDINSSMVSFLLNGQVISEGKGLKNFKFTAPKAGISTEFKISIITADGVNIEKKYNIAPANIDLLWFAESFVPPFYGGIPLYGYQGKVTVVAVPTFKTSSDSVISPENLIYSWKKNSDGQANLSGRGKQSFSFDGSMVGREVTVSVEVFSPENGLTGTASLSFEPLEQQLVLYRRDPLFGIMWNRAIPNLYKMTEGEAEIHADPYYFDIKDYNQVQLNYKWKIGLTEFPDLLKKNNVLLKPKDATSGNSQIEVTINNSVHILQQAKAGIGIEFNKQNEE